MPEISGGSMFIPVRVTNPKTGKSADTVFRIDTGSDYTALCMGIASKIDARPSDFVMVQGVDRDPVDAPVYKLDLDVQGCPVGKVQVIGLDFSGMDYGGLLGNDVLDRGLLVRDGEAGRWYFYLPGCYSETSTAGQNNVLVAAGAIGIALGAVYVLNSF